MPGVDPHGRPRRPILSRHTSTVIPLLFQLLAPQPELLLGPKPIYLRISNRRPHDPSNIGVPAAQPLQLLRGRSLRVAPEAIPQQPPAPDSRVDVYASPSHTSCAIRCKIIATLIGDAMSIDELSFHNVDQHAGDPVLKTHQVSKNRGCALHR